MNIQQYETRKGKKKYILNGAYIGVDVLTGKQVRTTITGTSKADIRRKLQVKINEFEKNGFTTKERIPIKTVQELIDVWLESAYKGTVKEQSFYATKLTIDKYIVPYFGEFKVERLTPAVLQSVINTYVSDVSPNLATYKLPLAYLSRIFKYGVILNLMDYNPMDKIIIPTIKKEKSKKDFYTRDQIKIILDSLDRLDKDSHTDNRFKIYIKLLIFTGMRASEALALDWTDIDFENMQITINKSLVPRTGEASTTKTSKSNRVIDIDEDTVQMLNEYKKVFTFTCWSLGVVRQPSAIFYSFRMKKHTRYLAMLRDWTKFIESIDIPYLGGLHCLRHAHATMCVASGMDYKILQERLGHEKLAITMDTYAHVEPEISKKAVATVMKFIANG